MRRAPQASFVTFVQLALCCLMIALAIQCGLVTFEGPSSPRLLEARVGGSWQAVRTHNTGLDRVV